MSRTITLLSLLLFTALILSGIQTALCEDVKVVVDWEPRECGEVLVEPPGLNYTIGTQVAFRAVPKEFCRFSMWITDLGGLNGTITNPMYVTLFSNAYVKAVFIKIGESGKTNETTISPEYVFVKITANISNFESSVKIARIGDEVWISAPREVALNDSARYVFVGWGGDINLNTSEPMARIIVTKNTHAIALYKLYMRYLEIWYPAEEFTYFYAPIIDVANGERLTPKALRVGFANITLPLNTPIPREFLARIEPVYVKQYKLSVRCIGCGELGVIINGERLNIDYYVERWFDENSTVSLRIVSEETLEGWVTGERSIEFKMDSPKNHVIECEPKPHSWAIGSPFYPILDILVKQFKNTNIYPLIYNIVSSPNTAYASIAGFFGAVAGIVFGAYLGFRKLSSRLSLGRGRESFAKLIKKGGIEKAIDVFETGQRVPERVLKIEDTVFPSIGMPRILQAPANPARIEPTIKPKIAEPKTVETEKIDVESLIESGGELKPMFIVEAVSRNPSIYLRLLDALESGRISIGVGYPVREVDEILEGLEKGAVALAGGDMYLRLWISDHLSLSRVFKTARLEDAMYRSIEEAGEAISKLRANLIILGDGVDEESTKNIVYVSRLMDIKVLKLSPTPIQYIRNVIVDQLSVYRIFGYIVYKMCTTGVRLNIEEALKLVKIAMATRGYITVDKYFEKKVKGDVDLDGFEQEEINIAFDRNELEALEIWRSGGTPREAIRHYVNLVNQLDPSRADLKIQLFGEKVEKLVKLSKEYDGLVAKLKALTRIHEEAKPLEKHAPRSLEENVERIASSIEKIVRETKDSKKIGKVVEKLEEVSRKLDKNVGSEKASAFKTVDRMKQFGEVEEEEWGWEDEE